MNLKKQVNKISEKLIEGIGNVSIKVGEQATDICVLTTLYEPKMPEELLKGNIDK
ncbi:cyclic lactone autoinducer peptide [Clostridium felsineum]|uniref:Uncharacterized protein n=1 Tax=Clostridium felsineum TaxID=36839 RepID=A0A1S8MBQ5_9CLOT|nr:cyclic lactone autoinducer peptide [Clostridium felsineum]URZ08971.1 hypothetical protein CLROS_043750 [Clostridium felsineum]URZ09599.1 hypothetical protein CROST_002800 [Clostridium felsineum]